MGWIDYAFQNILAQRSDNIKYKPQKPCNEKPSLKSTDLRQTQRFTDSWSISTALVPYSLRFSQIHWYYNSNIMSKLYCTYINHVAIPKNKKQKKKTATKQTKTETRYNSHCLHHKWRCYQAIALNDQQVMPTSLALLSP